MTFLFIIPLFSRVDLLNNYRFLYILSIYNIAILQSKKDPAVNSESSILYTILFYSN